MNYLERCVDGELREKLAYAGAVCIRGPKWCGKTSTALHQANSSVFLQDPDRAESNLELARVKPSVLLEGPIPRLIDEWQDAPQLWDAVRFAVDRGAEPGSFILTGSAVPKERPRHTGTGRFTYLDMRPMSLFESRDSDGSVSLAALFDGEEPSGHSEADVETIAYLVCRGGWPRAATVGGTSALRFARDYVAAVCDEDVSRVDGVERNPDRARLVMAEYARCTASATSLNTIRADLAAHGGEMSKDTVNAYVAALRKLFVIEDLEAWTPSLHARSRVSKTPARFFCDPSTAAAALGARPARLLRDLSTLGLLFESLCVRDLRVYAEQLDGIVRRYHDNTGLEADAVVELEDGRYALLEVKLGHAGVDAGASSLRKLAAKLDTSVMGNPSFMAVLVPGGYAYRREDGVLVVPVSCLRP